MERPSPNQRANKSEACLVRIEWTPGPFQLSNRVRVGLRDECGFTNHASSPALGLLIRQPLDVGPSETMHIISWLVSALTTDPSPLNEQLVEFERSSPLMGCRSRVKVWRTVDTFTAADCTALAHHSFYVGLCQRPRLRIGAPQIYSHFVPNLTSPLRRFLMVIPWRKR